MIDHLSVGVLDIDSAGSFYDAVLATLGYDRLATTEGFVAYGKARVEFIAISPANGQAPTPGNGVHICFAAPDKESVKRFHQTALEFGGTCEGAPGPRETYPLPDVFTTFVCDPYGNKLEAIYGGFSGCKRSLTFKGWFTLCLDV